MEYKQQVEELLETVNELGESIEKILIQQKGISNKKIADAITKINEGYAEIYRELAIMSDIYHIWMQKNREMSNKIGNK